MSDEEMVRQLQAAGFPDEHLFFAALKFRLDELAKLKKVVEAALAEYDKTDEDEESQDRFYNAMMAMNTVLTEIKR